MKKFFSFVLFSVIILWGIFLLLISTYGLSIFSENILVFFVIIITYLLSLLSALLYFKKRKVFLMVLSFILIAVSFSSFYIFDNLITEKTNINHQDFCTRIKNDPGCTKNDWGFECSDFDGRGPIDFVNVTCN